MDKTEVEKNNNFEIVNQPLSNVNFKHLRKTKVSLFEGSYLHLLTTKKT